MLFLPSYGWRTTLAPKRRKKKGKKKNLSERSSEYDGPFSIIGSIKYYGSDVLLMRLKQWISSCYQQKFYKEPLRKHSSKTLSYSLKFLLCKPPIPTVPKSTNLLVSSHMFPSSDSEISCSDSQKFISHL